MDSGSARRRRSETTAFPLLSGHGASGRHIAILICAMAMNIRRGIDMAEAPKCARVAASRSSQSIQIPAALEPFRICVTSASRGSGSRFDLVVGVGNQRVTGMPAQRDDRVGRHLRGDLASPLPTRQQRQRRTALLPGTSVAPASALRRKNVAVLWRLYLKWGNGGGQPFVPEQKIARTWEEIAALASNEKDSQKLYDLVKELNLALEERDRRLNKSSEGNKTGTGVA